MKIGLLREGKVPIDKRVPLTPAQCNTLKNSFSCEVVVQPSPIRAIADHEYTQAGISLQENLEDCDVLMGVKEVPIDQLLEGKTYFFFSHTFKEQPYNAKLLRACVDKNIRLIDYELLVKEGKRVVAFGRFAGLVGAYNALRGYGEKSATYTLKPAHHCHDLKEMFSQLQGRHWSEDIKILLTGKGRVASGAVETLRAAAIPEVSPSQMATAKGPFWSQLDVEDYYKRTDGGPFDRQELFENPAPYSSNFLAFAPYATLYIAGHYYDHRAPFIFTREDARHPSFAIEYVADISCDIDGPVASTLRPSTIDEPFYGYHPIQEKEVDHLHPEAIGVMAVDNLPCELSRDASESFGSDLLANVLPALFNGDADGVLKGATECENGKLTEKFSYLARYITEI